MNISHILHLQRNILQALACGILALLCCSRREVQQEPKPVERAVVEEFVAPPDSLISLQQARAWKLSGRMLDTLSIRFHQPLSTENSEKRLRLEKKFRHAQDSVCVISGLTGGYRHYCWISKNIYRETNRHLLDSIGISY